MTRAWLCPAVVAAVTFATFLPSIWGEFLLWDDHHTLVINPHYRGLGGPQLRWMLTTPHMGHFTPVTWLTLGLDYLVWGMDPRGYHLTSVLLHTASAVLVYALCIRILGLAGSRDAGADVVALRVSAMLAALIFAVHPLRVESVAWVTERRDVLGALLYLLAVLAYLRRWPAGASAGGSRPAWYLGALAVFVLALAAKAMAVSLPVVLLILDVYPLRRLSLRPRRWLREERAVILEKVPFVLLSAAASAGAIVASRALGSASAPADLTLAERLALTAQALVQYLWTTLVPIGLSPLYALPRSVDVTSAFLLACQALVALVTAGLVVASRRWPALPAAWAAYLALLLPVLGLFAPGPQRAADRYTYLASIPLSMLLAAGGVHLFRPRRHPGLRLAWGAAAVAALAVLCVLIVLTSRQILVWRTTTALWSHAISVAPSGLAHTNLAEALLRDRRWEEAIKHAATGVAEQPGLAHAHYTLGLALAALGGRESEAIAAFRRALRLDPEPPHVHHNLAVVLARSGRLDEAVHHLREALRRKPDYLEALRALEIVLRHLGRIEEADEQTAAIDRLRRVKP